MRPARALRPARVPGPREHEVQGSAADALRLCGLTVLHTTAFRQRGPSGVSRGVPDLLAWHPALPYAALAIEMKRPGRVRWSNPEQRALAEARSVYVAQSVEDALLAAADWLVRYGAGDAAAADGVRRIRAFLAAMER